MCSTCNWNNYEKVIVNDTEKLERSFGLAGIVIRCDLKGEDWKMAIRDVNKEATRIYRCPTCGRQLF